MNTLCAITILGLVALATAADMLYNGKFDGKCVQDGLYFKDRYSFVLCSGGQSSEQKCAPGSANDELASYSHGQNLNRNHFCTINLLPYGNHQINLNAKNPHGFPQYQAPNQGYNGAYPGFHGNFPYYYGNPYAGYPFPYFFPGYGYRYNYNNAAPYRPAEKKIDEQH